MIRPEVRVIQHQEEWTNSNMSINQSDVDSLLAKYGFKKEFINDPVPKNDIHQNDNQLTIEEMYQRQLFDIEQRRQKEHQRRFGPKPITFDERNVNYSNREWKDLEIEGQNLGIQIQIVSNIPIKY